MLDEADAGDTLAKGCTIRMVDWNERYLEGTTPWDLGEAAGPLVALVQAGRFPVPAEGRVLVPGAGKAHDAIFLAEAGYRVTALDLSEEAAAIGRRAAEERGGFEGFGYEVGDLFALPGGFRESFDAVYELTCYCAIRPEQRGAYAEAMSACLVPGGHWIGLVYPLDQREGGPPFTVDPEELVRNMEACGMEHVASWFPEQDETHRKGQEQWSQFRKTRVTQG